MEGAEDQLQDLKIDIRKLVESCTGFRDSYDPWGNVIQEEYVSGEDLAKGLEKLLKEI